jgi:hypothetical protein
VGTDRDVAAETRRPIVDLHCEFVDVQHSFDAVQQSHHFRTIDVAPDWPTVAIRPAAQRMKKFL